MDLLCKYPETRLELSTYCSVLQLCADTKSIKDGRKVHSLLSSNGIKIDSVLGSKLVFMYVTCGDLESGKRIFDEIANEKVFLWNFLMNEYAKIGNYRESISLYIKMRKLGIKANSHTFSCVLKCFATVRAFSEGETAHGYLLKLGFASQNTVVNSLVTFYFRFKRIDRARKLFDELVERDVISWNSMISGYVSNNLCRKALELFEEMLRRGVSADLATIICVSSACANIGTLFFGRAIHAYALKSHFENKITLNNTLLDMYSKCGDLNGAIRVFDNMTERTVVSWTSMIAGFTREGLYDKAIKSFREMKRVGIKPDIFTITTILHACACNGSLEDGKIIHNYIRENNMQSNLYVCNSLIDMYSKCGCIEEAHSVFTKMAIRDIVSWNSMIGGYSKNSLSNEALFLFVKMQTKYRPDNRTVACVLPACASLSALDKGRELHGYVLRNGLFSDQYIINALVDMYVKCGALVLARLLFDRITRKDLISWTVMIAGYGMHGFGKEAITAFGDMIKEGIEPDEISFISVLYACSHSGLLDEGWKFFNIMRNECNIQPNLEHYACIVDLLSRTGKLSKAYKFIKAMPIEPDGTIWGALLCGCRIYHDVKLAETVAEKIFELEPGNTGYYVLLANIYAEAEKWEEVKKLRERICHRRLKKNPGCSWIEIKGKVVILFAGERSYPKAKEIDKLLKKVRMRMKEEGYFPNTKYALINAGEMEKEAALCGHSEKLAMGLGVLSLPHGKIIRVTKNLRVCGDCHETAKFMSKMLGREIVMRDSNRFHHFRDGLCSCRGYW